MKTRQSRRQTAKVSHSRWLAYATASAATALAGSHSAEAAIHYSGVVNVPFPPNRDRSKTLRLGDPDGGLAFNHNFYSTNLGVAVLYLGDTRLTVRGFQYSSEGYVSKLSFGQNISTGFFQIYESYKGWLAIGDRNGHSHWKDPGIGYIGFRINNGAGIQYGWVRIRMSGAPLNGFVLLDYAYGDPGEPIRAGQTSSNQMVPKEGSLGWLAFGAVGLLAWRKRRSLTGILHKAT